LFTFGIGLRGADMTVTVYPQSTTIRVGIWNWCLLYSEGIYVIKLGGKGERKKTGQRKR